MEFSCSSSRKIPVAQMLPTTIADKSFKEKEAGGRAHGSGFFFFFKCVCFCCFSPKKFARVTSNTNPKIPEPSEVKLKNKEVFVFQM